MDLSQDNEIQEYPENDPPRPAERSADMPMLWDEAHCRLIDSCVRNESLVELFLQLHKLADDLDGNQTMKANNFLLTSTVNALRNFDWTMLELLHTMSVPVVRSIAKNTFAFDVHNRTITPFRIPSGKFDQETPGVYVVGLMMPYRGGQFLNIRELELLIHDMKLYAQGYEAFVKHDGWKAAMTPGEDKARRIVKAVDNSSGAQIDKDAGPLFIEKDEELWRIKALIKTFEGMCDRNLDPSGTIYSSQSPLYVGCSKNLKQRTQNYLKWSVKGINKPLGLTISILRKLNKPPEVTVGCVCRIIKKDQLSKAEQLVTTIAGSLVYQHGFNAVESGGTGPKSIPTDGGIKANIEYLICSTRVLFDNLKDSLQEVDLRARFLNDMAQVEGELVGIKEVLDECTEDLQNLPHDFKWNDTLEDISTLRDEIQNDLDDKQDAFKFWQLMLAIQDIIVEETGKGLDLL
ncbi:hypothetical protein FOYG_11641 [Fusarium oxysporum NRRL 32931]|uniref:Uncharacterized protein n=1 Tax=Fusarium oxysporum NRRL 32931 TaxID=660029 RepID=W9I4P7_FUSOX|nr:hypothetical protein FOYG_11641 [Fusarium oxysporum NRRL 32931]